MIPRLPFTTRFSFNQCLLLGAINAFKISSVFPENSDVRPPTLNIFPSQPMHVEPPVKVHDCYHTDFLFFLLFSLGSQNMFSQNMFLFCTFQASLGLVTPDSSGSKRPTEPSMELANPKNDANVPGPDQPAKPVKVGSIVYCNPGFCFCFLVFRYLNVCCSEYYDSGK